MGKNIQLFYKVILKIGRSQKVSVKFLLAKSWYVITFYLLAGHVLKGKKEIQIFGGSQLRPNIHIDDMTRAYSVLIKADGNKINRETFNIGSTECVISVSSFCPWLKEGAANKAPSNIGQTKSIPNLFASINTGSIIIDS